MPWHFTRFARLAVRARRARQPSRTFFAILAWRSFLTRRAILAGVALRTRLTRKAVFARRTLGADGAILAILAILAMRTLRAWFAWLALLACDARFAVHTVLTVLAGRTLGTVLAWRALRTRIAYQPISLDSPEAKAAARVSRTHTNAAIVHWLYGVHITGRSCHAQLQSERKLRSYVLCAAYVERHERHCCAHTRQTTIG